MEPGAGDIGVRPSMSGPPPRDIRFWQALDEAASRWGDAIGWVFDDVRVSFNDMRERSYAVARALIANGIGKDDVVAIWTPNVAEFAYCLGGCSMVGAILAPFNTRAKTFELEHQLSHSRAKLIVLVDRFLNIDFRSMIGEVSGAGTILEDGTVKSPRFPSLRRIVSLSQPAAPEAMPWRSFLDTGAGISDDRLEAERNAVRWDDPLLLQYTSGTTALPKGALCNHRYVLYYSTELLFRLRLGEGLAMLNTQPFYHVGGSCAAIPVPLSLGCRIVTPYHYREEDVFRLIERERCVARTGFASMYVMELNHPAFSSYDMSSLRTSWYVGGPEVMQEIRDRTGMELIQVYGMTEGCGVSGRTDEPWDIRLRSCGRPYPGVALKIIDPGTGTEAAAGGSGEILIRGYAVMNGYLRQPEETAKTIDPEGWVHTGDYGKVDSDGYIYFLGRLKSLMKVGGENVSPEEVESVLQRHPAIKMASVFGVPDRRLEEVVCVALELKQGALLSVAEVIDFCRPRMANFRVPRHVMFVTEWPMTGSGKVMKHVLREQYLSTVSSNVAVTGGAVG